jgi:hypothetical protein
MADLRGKTNSELAEWIAGWKPSTKEYILGKAELDRRMNHGNTVRGWIAIGISGLALLVSIVALVSKWGS